MFKLFATGPRELIEPAANLLFDADPSPIDAVDFKEETRTLWRLDAFAPDEESVMLARDLVTEAFPELNCGVEAVIERDWVTLSLEGLPPVFAGDFVVAGSHALSALSPGRTRIVIEAGPAFGTGHHGTTLGCLLAFSRQLRRSRPARVLDLGTGSGVLAIAAVRTGSRRVLGTDIDAESVRVANANARNNATQAAFHALRATGANQPVVRAGAPYDTIFANILARPLIGLAPDLARLIRPGGWIILSGLLNAQEPLVRAAYAGRGLTLLHRIRRDGWSTLVYRRPGRSA
jgi:ribosomal protein L11 methyltransferase